MCPRCSNSKETIHHYLFECQAYARERHIRYRKLGRESDSLKYLLGDSEGIDEVTKYVNRTRRLKQAFGEILIPDPPKDK